ncbi:RES family NAD+ phosphorylase [Pseudomonas syringae]|uniref:RES family NAD+ phosphorylase n=1 Tax=Pseudomonas syringae TaxID=317 RepID=UPI001BCE9BE6|nr:RES family NAD+ phosphorylase [Pseudomonas syringae]QVI74239.1 RES domain-containing protein [Pseudomonas syringae]
MRNDMASSAHQEQVCYTCVHDAYLGRQIKRTGTSTICTLCSATRKCIPLSSVLARVEGILDAYVIEGEYFRRFADWGDSQEGDSLDTWVSAIFDCDNVEPIVEAVCDRLDSYGLDTNYSKRIYRLGDIGLQWFEFQEGMKHGQRFFNNNAKTFLDWIFKDLYQVSATSDEEAVVRLLTPEDAPRIYRARTCMTSTDVNGIAANPGRNLGAPPKERAGDGRMNPAGVPAFYGAFERETCIAELRPPVGGTVVSGEFRLNRMVRVLDFGRFEKADFGPPPSFFDPKHHAKTGRQELLKYLHNEITVPVLPGAERDYLTTQVIAEYLATYCNPRIDGVIFKSVQQSEGSNIVLFSHVACPIKPSPGRLQDSYTINANKGGDGPCVEYVNGSLVQHVICEVKYKAADEPLREGKPTFVVEPDF